MVQNSMFNNASILFLAKVANAQQSFLFGAANLALVFTTSLSLNSHQKSIFFFILVVAIHFKGFFHRFGSMVKINNFF